MCLLCFSVFLGNIKEAFDKDSHLKNLLLDDFFKNAIEKCQVWFVTQVFKQLNVTTIVFTFDFTLTQTHIENIHCWNGYTINSLSKYWTQHMIIKYIVHGHLNKYFLISGLVEKGCCYCSYIRYSYPNVQFSLGFLRWIQVG